MLIDRQAVETGAAAAGAPWQHYDLRHGYCSYTFFEQCPHRMACARCDFYLPKSSSNTPTLAGPTPRELAKAPLNSAATRPPASDGGAKPPGDRPLSSPAPPWAVARQGQA